MSMLIVLSEAFHHQASTLQTPLGELTDIVTACSFQQASSICQTNMPEIILAQTELDDGNAFDFCTRIRLLQDEKMTPFIIFSPQHDKKERVRTFQVGADEYINEFDFDYISAVVKHELDAKKHHDQLAQEKQQASNLVMEAMKSSSELGSAINFIERCHRFQSSDDIANEIISFCKTLDLKVVIGIIDLERWKFSSTSHTPTELERDLMQSIHAHDRIVDFGVRTQFNWPNIALLCKNMPLRDPEKYGRIKDLLPSLLSSANVRIHTLIEEHHIREQTDLMSRSIATLQPSIKEVINAMTEDTAKNRNDLSDFLQNIVVALPRLGLEDDQEDFFISRVEALIKNSDDMAAKNEGHRNTLEATNKVLINLLAKQNELQNAINKPLEIAEPVNNDDDLFELF